MTSNHLCHSLSVRSKSQLRPTFPARWLERIGTHWRWPSLCLPCRCGFSNWPLSSMDFWPAVRGKHSFLSIQTSFFSLSCHWNRLLASPSFRISRTEVNRHFYGVPLEGWCANPSDGHFEAHHLWTWSILKPDTDIITMPISWVIYGYIFH